MPSARDLAREHGTSTVQRAMDALKAEGWTVGVPGSGTYVADEMPPPPPPRPAPRRAADRLTAVEGDVAALKARFAEHERGHS
jgi:DNA-binding GntR family transcriptional regulator